MLCRKTGGRVRRMSVGTISLHSRCGRSVIGSCSAAVVEDRRRVVFLEWEGQYFSGPFSRFPGDQFRNDLAVAIKVADGGARTLAKEEKAPRTSDPPSSRGTIRIRPVLATAEQEPAIDRTPRFLRKITPLDVRLTRAPVFLPFVLSFVLTRLP